MTKDEKDNTAKKTTQKSALLLAFIFFVYFLQVNVFSHIN